MNKRYLKLAGVFSYAVVVLIVSVSVGSSVFAATTGVVSATVTAQNISLTVTDGSVAYGTMGMSSTEDTTTGGVNDSQTATNNGNITEDFNIMGQDSAAWTLGASAGSETYAHKFCTSSCDASPVWNALTTGYQTLATGVGTSGTQEFDLQMNTPTSTATFTEQTVNVTVQAVAN